MRPRNTPRPRPCGHSSALFPQTPRRRSSSRSLYALVVVAATAARGMLLHRGLSSVIALDAKQLASALICLN
jgi:hypothetical protein